MIKTALSKRYPKYKIRDTVYYISSYSAKSEFHGKNIVIDIIEDNIGDYWYALENVKRARTQWVSEEDLFDNMEDGKRYIIKREKEKEEERIRKEKEKEERIRKKKELMKDIDPFEEEIWENLRSYSKKDILEQQRNKFIGKKLCFYFRNQLNELEREVLTVEDIYMKYGTIWMKFKEIDDDAPMESYVRNAEKITILKSTNNVNTEIDPLKEEDWDEEVELNEKIDNYFTFEDLVFTDWMYGSKRAAMTFDNGRKISVVFSNINHQYFYSNGVDTYELAEFNQKDEIDDVHGFLSEIEITYEMIRIQKIEPKKRTTKPDIDPFGEENWDDDVVNERRVLYKKELCQDIWDGKELLERMRIKLIKIAKDFFEEIELETEIKDIHFTGSLANYNYTEDSDIDVHIMIDFKDVSEDVEIVKMAVDGQRFMWNLRHNIVIKGHNVELYIADEKEEHKSSGIYSLIFDEWIIRPKYNPPDVDTKDVDIKYDARNSDIVRLEKISKTNLDPSEAEEYYTNAKDLKSKIMKARKSSLTENGEFSIENLVFKKLRREGKIKKLIDTIGRLYDKIYSQD